MGEDEPEVEPVFVFEQTDQDVWKLTGKQTLEGLRFPASPAEIAGLARTRNWTIEYRGHVRKFRDMKLTAVSEPRRVPLRVAVALSGVKLFNDESQLVGALRETVKRLSHSATAAEIRMNTGFSPADFSDPWGP